jgi:2-keto-4-pentenoate hydratase/2-oxohepta-3-ene-1,7-dioic acid hydratase in catechol pathway
VSKFLPVSDFADLKNIQFRLDINGVPVQNGNTSDMIFHFDRLVSHVSKYITVRMGDLLFTGTPAGVGPVKIGDRLQGYIEDALMLDFYIR